MGFGVKVEARINVNAHLAKVRSDEFWKFGANEWWKLITPYTPMDMGTLFETVEIRPKEVEYKAPHAHYLYKGELMVDPETRSSYARHGVKKVYAGRSLKISRARHPLASKEWDKAARPTQKPKLVKAMQGYVDSGRLNF